MQYATWPRARQRPRPDAEKFCGNVSCVLAGTIVLVGRDAGVLDDPGPLNLLAVCERGELLRGVRRRLDADVGETLHRFRAGHRLHQVGVDLFHQGLRHAAGTAQAVRSVLRYSERLERGFRPLWPSLHAHLTKHPDGDTQVISRLLLVARLGGEFSESELALRFQRPHPKLVRQGQSFVISLSSPVGLRRLSVAMDVA